MPQVCLNFFLSLLISIFIFALFSTVAAELFPVMLESSHEASYIGISCGFFIGLSTIYGVEHLVEYLESTPEDELFGERRATNLVKSIPKGFEPRARSDSKKAASDSGEETSSLDNSAAIHEYVAEVGVNADTWHDDDVEKASLAISAPQHRDHIVEHLMEVLDSICYIEEKSKSLAGTGLTVRETEDIAEHIDEKIHALQYKLDHCRR